MIGAIVYELRALNSDSLPEYQGQLLHGLCFKLIKNYSEELAEKVHDRMNIKPFTVAELDFSKKIALKNKRYWVTEGSVIYWRVTALQDEVLKAFLSAKRGRVFRLGKLELLISDVITDGELREYVGLAEPKDMIEEFFSTLPPEKITMDFASPTAFRVGKNDYPYPAPELVFGSLADKWQAMNMPIEIDCDLMRKEAKQIIPCDWQGATCRIFLSEKRSVKGFRGKFTYSLKNLTNESKQTAALLAAYAELSGVGRYTAHGMGQTRIRV